MNHLLDAGLVAFALSSLFYVLLGAWVLTLGPRRVQTTLLGSLAVLFGLRFAGIRLFLYGPLPVYGELGMGLWAAVAILSSGAALGLAWTVPEPLEDRRTLGLALGLGAGLGLGLVYTMVVFGSYPYSGGTFGLFVLGWSLGHGALWAAIVLLALRASPAKGARPGEVTQLALLSVAFAMVEAFAQGGVFPLAAEHVARGALGRALNVGMFTSGWLLAAAFWGWNMLRAGAKTARIHRYAMLGILGMLAAGALVEPLGLPLDVVFAVVQTAGVALLAYGILRHDLAGLDEKVEFGVSKTTVAGIFVAVFFVVSEGAQVLLADFAGNELLGVLAAGLLVFAISPLQRFADRFAAKAVPGGAQEGHEGEASYREAVELTLTDGEITPDEETRLAELADRLGVPSRRALEIRREVEDEAGSKGGAA